MSQHEAAYLVGQPITQEHLDYISQIEKENYEMRVLLRRLYEADIYGDGALDQGEWSRVEYYVNQ